MNDDWVFKITNAKNAVIKGRYFVKQHKSSFDSGGALESFWFVADGLTDLTEFRWDFYSRFDTNIVLLEDACRFNYVVNVDISSEGANHA